MANTDGMSEVRVLVNIMILALPLLIPKFRKWFFSFEKGTFWINVLYALLIYHWVIFSVEDWGGKQVFVFQDYGSWATNMWAYWWKDWGTRAGIYCSFFNWTLGGILIVALLGVWGGDFFFNIDKKEKLKFLFLVPIILGTYIGWWLTMYPANHPM